MGILLAIYVEIYAKIKYNKKVKIHKKYIKIFNKLDEGKGEKIMNKLLKIIPLVVLVLMLALPVKTEAFPTFDEMQSQASDWLEKGQNNGKVVKEDDIANIMLPIGQFLVGIGAVVLISVTIIMGIKYMTAEPNDRAKLKQQFIGLVISTIVIFGAYSIWRIVYNFMDGIVK